jgi:hypothetical protein
LPTSSTLETIVHVPIVRFGAPLFGGASLVATIAAGSTAAGTFSGNNHGKSAVMSAVTPLISAAMTVPDANNEPRGD